MTVNRLVLLSWFYVIGLLLIVFLLVGCGSASTPLTPTPVQANDSAQKGGQNMTLKLTSPAFAQEQPIPQKFSCDGEDVSPALQWSGPPPNTQSLALIMDDPDAPVGTWVHWVLFNLPADSHTLPEAVAPEAELADGSRHGQNSWKRLGYGGPCPPHGTHRYFFKLYALDVPLNLSSGADKGQLLQAMEGHILVQTELMGTYSR